jgi:hypothetical protein
MIMMMMIIIIIIMKITMPLTLFQRWNNPERLILSVLVYVLFTITVFVFCWLGSELSDQESITE